MPERTRVALTLLAAWGFVLAAMAAIVVLVGADMTEQERAPLM